MGDAFDKIFPIITLVVGVWLTSFFKRGEVRNAMRLEAADRLAELPALLWEKEDDDAWIDLNAALDRLGVRLRLAGVPDALTEPFKPAAIEFWQPRRAHVP